MIKHATFSFIGRIPSYLEISALDYKSICKHASSFFYTPNDRRIRKVGPGPGTFGETRDQRSDLSHMWDLGLETRDPKGGT